MKIKISRGCFNGKPFFKAQIVTGGKILSFMEGQLCALSQILTGASARDLSGVFSECDFKRGVIDNPLDFNTTLELRLNVKNKTFVFIEPLDLYDDSIEDLQRILKERVEAIRKWVKECEVNQSETFEINL
jgi:hypothetical protein